MTTRERVVEQVRAVLGKYSLATFVRDCARFKIKPLTELRFRPQAYPVTTAARILAARGYEAALVPLAPMDTAAARVTNLPTVAALKKARRAAKGKARK